MLQLQEFEFRSYVKILVLFCRGSFLFCHRKAGDTRERGTGKIRYMWPQSHTNERIKLRLQGTGNARYKDFQLFVLLKANKIFLAVYHYFFRFSLRRKGQNNFLIHESKLSLSKPLGKFSKI